MKGPFVIGIDLGGTNARAGLFDPAGELLARRSIATQAERGPRHVIGRLAELARAVAAERGVDMADVEAVGIGAPGPLSYARGVVLHAPNLPGWRDIALRDLLSAAVGRPVALENDANVAAFGEFTAGAGRDVRDMVMLTLGTGIGGGVVLGGKLLRGHFDNAGEIGHMIVEPRGRPCPCGQRGCLERYASANALALRLTEAVRAGEASSLRERIERGDPLDARDVEQAAEAGDALAGRIWDETCFYLGLAVVHVQHTFNPQQVVLAGGLIRAGQRLLRPVQQHARQLTWQSAPDLPEIALATLGDDAGIIGAAALCVA